MHKQRRSLVQRDHPEPTANRRATMLRPNVVDRCTRTAPTSSCSATCWYFGNAFLVTNAPSSDPWQCNAGTTPKRSQALYLGSVKSQKSLKGQNVKATDSSFLIVRITRPDFHWQNIVSVIPICPSFASFPIFQQRSSTTFQIFYFSKAFQNVRAFRPFQICQALSASQTFQASKLSKASQLPSFQNFQLGSVKLPSFLSFTKRQARSNTYSE